MAFLFRFASILQLRRRQRDEAGAAVGQVNEAIRRVDQQVESIQQEHSLLRAGFEHRRLGNVSVDGLLAEGRYELQLQAQLQALAKTRDELTGELHRRQQALVTAEAEVRRFERLEEQDRIVFRKEQFRKELAQADDAAASQYIMERRRPS